ncbi:UNVERIFIED_CONTAM: hypothetical protein GTU68_000283 [Idotea baltica]|nr:hypothetical protein [Idotea baltica]
MKRVTSLRFHRAWSFRAHSQAVDLCLSRTLSTTPAIAAGRLFLGLHSDRRPDAEAFPSPCPWARRSHSQAHVSYHDIVNPLLHERSSNDRTRRLRQRRSRCQDPRASRARRAPRAATSNLLTKPVRR